jgi:hypothetical protein
MSKRHSISTPPLPLRPISPHLPDKQEQEALDKIIREASGKPVNVIDKILATTAPPPKTAEEQHSELEDKVIRECIREYTKGDMYFSYTFGTIIHNSDIFFELTMKQTLLARCSINNSNTQNLTSSTNYSRDSARYPHLRRALASVHQRSQNHIRHYRCGGV